MLNENIRDAGNFFKAPPACILQMDTVQYSGNNVWDQIPYTTEIFDNDSMADAVNGWITIQTAGLYVVTASLTWSANTAGRRLLGLATTAPGGTVPMIVREETQPPSASGGACTQNVSGMAYLNVGDNVQVFAFQSSGSASLATSVQPSEEGRVTAVWLGA
jgi:hypothetical protein